MYNHINIICDDSIIEWRKYSKEDNIFNKFHREEWNKIISGFSSNDEWNDFLLIYKNNIECFSLYNRKDNNLIGFAFISLEDFKRNIYSIHGGGCSKKNCFLYFRGFICLLSHLLNLGIKIRTVSYKENNKAIRFLHATGFVKYQEKENVFRFWINKKRLQSSKIYKRTISNTL